MLIKLYMDNSILSIDGVEIQDTARHIKATRQLIDSVTDPKKRFALRLLYLTGARASELAGRPVNTDDIAYGIQAKDVKKGNYRMPDGTVEDLVLINIRILKKRIPNEVPIDERRERYPKRIVALPLKYEPWASNILAVANSVKDPSKFLIPNTRKEIWQWISEVGLQGWKDKNGYNLKNPLRHIRANHLISYYQFTPIQLVTYFGWGHQTLGNITGQATSPMLDWYLNLSWQGYIMQLMIPLPS